MKITVSYNKLRKMILIHLSLMFAGMISIMYTVFIHLNMVSLIVVSTVALALIVFTFVMSIVKVDPDTIKD